MKVVCPKCHSDQLTANQKGFSGGKAVAGAILTGGVGLLAGNIGSKKIKITCLACGNTFGPGEGNQIREEGDPPPPKGHVMYGPAVNLTEAQIKKRKKFNAWAFGFFLGIIILVWLLSHIS